MSASNVFKYIRISLSSNIFVFVFGFYFWVKYICIRIRFLSFELNIFVFVFGFYFSTAYIRYRIRFFLSTKYICIRIWFLFFNRIYICIHIRRFVFELNKFIFIFGDQNIICSPLITIIIIHCCYEKKFCSMLTPKWMICFFCV